MVIFHSYVSLPEGIPRLNPLQMTIDTDGISPQVPRRLEPRASCIVRAWQPRKTGHIQSFHERHSQFWCSPIYWVPIVVHIMSMNMYEYYECSIAISRLLNTAQLGIFHLSLGHGYYLHLQTVMHIQLWGTSGVDSHDVLVFTRRLSAFKHSWVPNVTHAIARKEDTGLEFNLLYPSKIVIFHS